MMTSRTIGYQEKNEKQSTAPIKNPQAAPLRRARGSNDAGRRGPAANGVAARRATPVSTFANAFSCPLRWRSGPSDAERAAEGPPAPRPGSGESRICQNDSGFLPYAPLFASSVLTLEAAVLSSAGMFALGSVSTASMTGSSVL